jgi:hypothetical protein
VQRSEKIAIAEITSVLSKGELIDPKSNPDVWPDILRRAGFPELAKQKEALLVPFTYNGGFTNPNPRFDRISSTLFDILIYISQPHPFSDNNMLDVHEFLKTVVEEIDPLTTIKAELVGTEARIFDDEIKLNEKKKNILSQIESNPELWNSHGILPFKKFLRAIRVLSLDIKIVDGQFALRPLTTGVANRDEDTSSLEAWLQNQHPEVHGAYLDAINNYIEERPGSCIADCRVALTGLFSNYTNMKDWFNGVLQLTPDSYNDAEKILKIKNAAVILQDKAEEGATFPRFKLVYRAYALYCELGPHRTEGVEEEPTINDALWCLRILEDVMIWVMNLPRNNS